jgi:hypothetical protein
VNRVVRRGPKREEENARIKRIERKRRMEAAAVRKRRRECGEGDARVAGFCGRGWLLCRGEVVFRICFVNCLGRTAWGEGGGDVGFVF